MLRVEDLQICRGRKTVLADVTLDVLPGEVLGVLPVDTKPENPSDVLKAAANGGQIMRALASKLIGKVPPGADIQPYHNRQIALLSPPDWRAWLDGSVSSKELLRPAEAGGLSVAPMAA